MRGTTNLIHVPVHRLGPLLPTLQPPLRPVLVSVLAKHAPVLVQHPRVERDARLAWVPVAVDLGAGRGHMAGDVETNGGADAHGFFERGLKVRQALCFGIGDDWGEVAVSVGGVDLGEEGGVGGGGFEDVVYEGLHG